MTDVQRTVLERGIIRAAPALAVVAPFPDARLDLTIDLVDGVAFWHARGWWADAGGEPTPLPRLLPHLLNGLRRAITGALEDVGEGVGVWQFERGAAHLRRPLRPSEVRDLGSAQRRSR